MLTTLAARTSEEVEKNNTHGVINIDIEPEHILEGHTLQHGPNHLSAAHTSRHEFNVLSPRHATQREPISSDTFNLTSLNGISESVPEGHASRHDPRRPKTEKGI